MTEGEVIQVVHEAIYLAWVCAAPMILAGICGGLAVGLQQALFQVRDPMISWAPRVLFVGLACVLASEWLSEAVRMATVDWWFLIREVGLSEA